MTDFLFNEDCLFFNNSILYFYKLDDLLINKFNIKKIEDNYKNYDLLCIEIDRYPNMIKRFNLHVLPTFIFYKNGIEEKRIEKFVI